MKLMITVIAVGLLCLIKPVYGGQPTYRADIGPVGKLGQSRADVIRYLNENQMVYGESNGCMVEFPNTPITDCHNSKSIMAVRTATSNDDGQVVSELLYMLFNQADRIVDVLLTTHKSNPKVTHPKVANLIRRAKAGVPSAQFELASYYYFGLRGLGVDHAKAIELWNNACQGGHIPSCHNAEQQPKR